MLVNTAQADHNPFGRLNKPMRQGPNCHRRTVSCIAVAAPHEHYNHPAYQAGSTTRLFDTLELDETEENYSADVNCRSASASTFVTARPIPVKAGMPPHGIATATAAGDSSDTVLSVATSSGSGSFGKLVKVNPAAPVPRRSLLSDLLNNQSQGVENNGGSRLEQSANRRRMLKSMRRYSLDVSDMNIYDALRKYPGSNASTLKPISSEGEGGAVGSTQLFADTPTIRYLGNPPVKSKLLRRGADGDNDGPDYFGGEDRVW